MAHRLPIWQWRLVLIRTGRTVIGFAYSIHSTKGWRQWEKVILRRVAMPTTAPTPCQDTPGGSVSV